MTPSLLDQLSALLGAHGFRDPKLLKVLGRGRDGRDLEQERLEYVGDAVLGLVAAEELYRRWPRGDQAFLSKARAQLVSAPALASVAVRVGGLPEKDTDKQLSDLVEICAGALYLDASLDAVRDRALQWFAEDLQRLADSGIQPHPKTELQEYLQARGEAIPVYIFEEGPDSAYRVTLECRCGGREHSYSLPCKRRRDGERETAAEVLRRLRGGA